ncbi:MAG TPA: hypothetical protein VFA11_07175 [Acidimicrobiales bacterium]|nr:hypothetical protein [Acidimicrobiales bacterium]
MELSRIPTWVLVVFGLVAVVAGILGATHAPPAIGKATWAVVAVLGVVTLVLAGRRRRLVSGVGG